MSDTQKVRARAVGNSQEWGYSSKGTEQVGVQFIVMSDGDFRGQSFTWYGYFTPAAEERTLDSLRAAGWDGTDVLALPGLGSVDVELTLQSETSQAGEKYWRASYVNRAGVSMKNKMDAAQKAAFAARMRNVLGSKGVAQAKPAVARGTMNPAEDQDDLPF